MASHLEETIICRVQDVVIIVELLPGIVALRLADLWVSHRPRFLLCKNCLRSVRHLDVFFATEEVRIERLRLECVLLVRQKRCRLSLRPLKVLLGTTGLEGETHCRVALLLRQVALPPVLLVVHDRV